MRILLLNDNPVVRKLVALSAQKTKDDLQVVWSIDEIEHPAYDLLIVDDAHYSDEVMEQLNEKITYKSSLLMATRGNATPNGFDKVINKPFLPTDLVDLFAVIEKSLPKSEEPATEEHKSPMIDLDSLEDDTLESLDSLMDEVDLGETKTSVLDHDEVQELQNLLDDTEEDSLSLDDFELDDLLGDEKSEESIVLDEDDDLLSMLDETSSISSVDEDEKLGGMNDLLLEDLALDDLALDEEIKNDDPLDFDNELLDDELGEVGELDSSIELPDSLEENDDFDDLLLELDGMKEESGEEEVAMEESLQAPLSDDEFDDLEQQIQDAIGDLGIEDLESDVEDLDLGELSLDSLNTESGLDGLDDLDMLDEKEIKLAIGEEVEEDEPLIRVGAGEHSSLDAEALNEAMGKAPLSYEDEDLNELNDAPVKSTTLQEEQKSPAEGIEALQTLLKALANDEVAKSLKGLNINININFGNDK